MVRVKICGITNVDDALMAVSAGADALGFVFHGASPRNVTMEQAAAIIRQLPPFVQTVGLFVNEHADLVNLTAEQCRLDMVQLHGDESPESCAMVSCRVIKAFRVRDAFSLDTVPKYDVAGYLLDAWSADAYGGTGHTFNWNLARSVAREYPVILAGGLTPDNVASAVASVLPFAVDVSSGVEKAPGKKDPEKVALFIRRAKGLGF